MARRNDDDDDDRQTSRRSRDDGDRMERRGRSRDDDDEKPRSRKPADDDEDEKPRSRRSRDDDDADEKPRGRDRDDDSGGRGFKYKRRSAEKVRERANMSGGDFDSIFKSKFKVYKVRDGKNLVRVLPNTWQDEPEHYGLDVWVNYGIGADKQSYLSLSKMKGEKDPLAEAKKEAERDGDKKVAKALAPRRRVLVWLIDRQAEEEGPQLWAMPFTVDKDIANMSTDEDTGDTVFMDDPGKEGADWRFYKTGKGLNTEYPASQMKLLTGRPLSEDEDQAAEWLDYIKENPLPSVLNYYDYDYLSSAFNGTVAVREDDDDTDEKPRGKGRRTRDDDADEKPRSRGRSRDDDDADEKPRSRKPADDDDEDEKPRSRRGRDDDDEDEKPRRRSSKDDDEDPPFDADKKPRRRGDDADDDDEDEKPKKGDDEGGSVKERLQRRRGRINDD